MAGVDFPYVKDRLFYENTEERGEATMAQIIKDHKKVLEELAQLIVLEEECAELIYTDPAVVKEKKAKLEIVRGKAGEKFHVLVIGAFSSGKSSMINALIGEELLPTGFLPETAVLGELHYGKEKRITMYPRAGKWEGGDEPFDLEELTSEEIEKYISLSADDALNAMEEDSENRIDAKFEKMVISWPLELLKDGVVLIDSPGINDPYSNDYIVNGYLPQADAIIYLMDAQAAYQKTDVNQLTIINETHELRNIVIGYTFYDVVEPKYAKKPGALEKYRRTLIAHAKKHSDLGEAAVHFLSSVDALEAKENNDPEMLRQSGYEGLENYLGRYLVEGKGRDQVLNMAKTIVSQARMMVKSAESCIQAARKDVAKLKENAARARKDLDKIRDNSRHTAEDYRMRLKNYLPEARRMTEDCIYGLAEKVDLEGFEPETQLPDGPRKLWPFGEGGARKRSEAIQKECQQELERRLNLRYREWSNQTLAPYLKKAVEESTRAIRPDLEQIARELNEVVSMVAGGIHSDNGDASNIALGLAYAIATGDWFTGSMSAIYGKGAMVRGIAFQAAAGAAVGIACLVIGVPITLPIVAVAAIGGSILSILTDNNKKKVEKIKVKAVEALRKSYKEEEARSSLRKKVDEIMANTESYIESACSDMENALAADIRETENSIQQMIDINETDQEEKQSRMAVCSEAVERLEEPQREAVRLCGTYGIASEEVETTGRKIV